MGFTLRHLRTGETKAFSTREVLEMLGDPVNDEIVVHNEVYRIVPMWVRMAVMAHCLRQNGMRYSLPTPLRPGTAFLLR